MLVQNYIKSLQDPQPYPFQFGFDYTNTARHYSSFLDYLTSFNPHYFPLSYSFIWTLNYILFCT
ncbi:hypothetical protein VCRA2126O85_70032 [Vibrio crassostreae]|nr:hypothetical protein VCRA2128O100_170062 [Vibrio crassostreae]CAK2664753.1 hypothetical protein VCRA2126O84_170063 [Vibrio crassostreae]CAK2666529.1 hypothetical protein VCRA2127O91_170063 [Vibrio crassostreae]CAK2676647.1 hypothetical protein VCRA2126O86_180063 [Vibrio crassostreae]CAK3081171.1 hypothetical protein VCRA2126O85_70032 [Vibrio crassostreae]